MASLQVHMTSSQANERLPSSGDCPFLRHESACGIPADGSPSPANGSISHGSSFRSNGSWSSFRANGSPFASTASSFRANGSSFPPCGNASSFPETEPSFHAHGSVFSANESSLCDNATAFPPNGSSFCTRAPAFSTDRSAFSVERPVLQAFQPASGSSFVANEKAFSMDRTAFLTNGSTFPAIGSAHYNSAYVPDFLSNASDILSNESTRSLEGLPLFINGSNLLANASRSPENFSSFREQGMDFPSDGASCAAVGPSFPSRQNSFPVQETVLSASTFLSKNSSRVFEANETHDASCSLITRKSSSASRTSESGLCQFVFGDLENINLDEEKSLYVNQGVTLAWRNLWVTIPARSNTGVRPLLQNLTGFAEPGHIMAIMGPSGSGKSTLLDTLAGRISPNTKQTGEIMVNGRRQVLTYGNSVYVTQDDVLMASLTVWEAVFYSAQLQLPKQMSIEEKRKRAETTIKDMGLQGAVNTRIGGWRARGLSGGEKRRVSIAIELLTRPRLLFLDEPTSGLDSAAAFNVVKRLRHLAVEGRTIVVSIHQPSGDVFELFDYLYLLSKGRTVYFGSIGQTREFFSINGFPCPPSQNPSDHYLRTINTDYEEDIENGAIGLEFKTKQVINLLVEAYANLGVALEMTNRVTDLLKEEGELLHTASDRVGFWTQVYVLTKRSFVNMYRDIGYYWFRLVMYITLALCIGTVFYNVGYSFSAIQARAALLMFVSALLTFMAIGGFPAFVEDLKVFDRERLNGHYGVASFFIANTLSSSPYLLLISSVPGAIAYFLAGLHPGFDRFIFFVLALFASVLVVESLMMMVASVVSDYLLGIIVGSGIQGLFLLTGGFFRLPKEIPKPLWRYPVSYLAFHTFSIQGFYKNDFEGLTFENNIAGQPPLVGDSILINSFQVMAFSKWFDLVILVGMAVAYRLLFFALIKSKERLRPLIRSFLSRRSTLRVLSNGDGLSCTEGQ